MSTTKCFHCDELLEDMPNASIGGRKVVRCPNNKYPGHMEMYKNLIKAFREGG